MNAMSVNIEISPEVGAVLSELAERKGTSESELAEQAIRDLAQREEQVRAALEKAMYRLSVNSRVRRDAVILGETERALDPQA